MSSSSSRHQLKNTTTTTNNNNNNKNNKSSCSKDEAASKISSFFSFPSLSSSGPSLTPGGSTALYYRDVCGKDVTLVETRHCCSGGSDAVASKSRNGAIEYVLKQESRRGFAGADLGLLCLGLALWTATRSPVSVALGFIGLGLAFRSALLTDPTNTLLLVESVGVHITNRKNIFGALEEYLPWNSIKDVFINEVISEQKVLYYLTFIVKELTSNGEEKIRLIPLFRDLKPERKCLEYINASDFAYSKELMKIIRRVIKWQPKQGQHFSTRNLLVTYNHASWTRQDKTFAVMKFCDRPDAIAFPHAFILTVKILDKEEQSKIEEMGAKAAKPDTEKPVMCLVDGNFTSSNGLPSENARADQENIDNIMPVNGQHEKENGDSKDISWSSRTRSRFKDPPDSPLVTNSLSSFTPEPEANESRDSNDTEKNATIDESHMQMDCDSSNSDHSELIDQSIEIEAKSQPSDFEDESDSSSDSQSEASLPYQYLIEKDIERTLAKDSRKEGRLPSPKSPSFVSNSDTTLVSNIEESSYIGSPSRDRKSIRIRSRQNSKDSDSLAPPEVTNLKSSDITDLVMKGLMFTIRQEKDKVTFVEQKTKLEVDEVLENSEKVETKAGDPCLLNSSLLRLEKMVTSMKEPVSLPPSEHGNVTSLFDPESLSPPRLDSDGIEMLDSISNEGGNVNVANSWGELYDDCDDETDLATTGLQKNSNDPTLCAKSNGSDDDIEIKVSETEADEEITPETLLQYGSIHSMSQMTSFMKESNDQPMEFDLTDELAKSADAVAEIASPEHVSSAPIMVNGISANKDSTKLPKIISNTLVTNDDLSPMLQKVLQNKLVSKNCQSSVNMAFNKDKSKCVHSDDSAIENIGDLTEELNGSFEIDVVDVNEDSLKINSMDTSLQTNNCDDLNSFIKIKDEPGDPLFSFEVADDTRSHSEVDHKVTESLISNSNSIDNLRITRSNSKSHATSAGIIADSVSSDSRLKLERQIETRSQRILDKSSSNQSSRTSVHQKRKNSLTDKSVSRVCKSNNVVNGQKDVKVNMDKLLRDLKYGVKIVVKRLDVNKILK